MIIIIELIHPALRNYRLELFEKLNINYDIKFIFTEYDPRNEPKWLNIPNEWKSEVISVRTITNWLRFIILLLKDDYELMIVGPAEKNYSLISIIISKIRTKKIILWGEGWYWSSNTVYKKLYNLAS